MPFIHIKSLPLKTKIDMPQTLKNISRSFEIETGIEQRHVTVTWEYFAPNHYIFAGVTGEHFYAAHHQIVVDLLIPDFNDQNTIEKMMRAIAAGLAANIGCSKEDIFINCRMARSGTVYDSGEVITW